jgi:hypothetical protein
MTPGTVSGESQAASVVAAKPYRWMAPAIWLERIRPGLRAATLADAERLRELPSIVSVLLPLLAVLLPAALSVVQATTQTGFQGDPYDSFALMIYDVFTESVPFMVVAAVIGLIAPSAGVLVVLTYAVGNVAATAVTGELEPLLPALFGRLVSFGILWVLVVEIPLAGRYLVEGWIDARSPRSRRRVAAFAGGLGVLGLVQAWVLATPVLITAVFYLSAGATPFLRANYQLAYSGYLVVLPVGAAAAVLLAVRYLGRDPHVGRQDAIATSPRGRSARWVFGIALTLALLSGFISQPIDAVVLGSALILAPPFAGVLLRRTGMARFLARVPWALRLLAGFGLALMFSVAFLALVGSSEISRWFNTVIALAISYLIIEVLLSADAVAAEEAASKGPAPSPGMIVGALIGLLPALLLAFPSVALADGTSSQPDTGDLRSAEAAAAGAILAAMLFPGFQEGLQRGIGRLLDDYRRGKSSGGKPRRGKPEPKPRSESSPTPGPEPGMTSRRR